MTPSIRICIANFVSALGGSQAHIYTRSLAENFEQWSVPDASPLATPIVDVKMALTSYPLDAISVEKALTGLANALDQQTDASATALSHQYHEALEKLVGAATPSIAPPVFQQSLTPILLTDQRILLVDDLISVRKATKRVLATAGAKVTEACDGQEAIQRLFEDAFDLIFCDLEMPRIDGFGVYYYALKVFGWKTRFILHSGADDKKMTELWRGNLESPRVVISKPANTQILLTTIQATLNLPTTHSNPSPPKTPDETAP